MSFNDFQLVNLIRRVEYDAANQRRQDKWASDVATAAEPVDAELRKSTKPFIQLVITRATQIAQLSGIGKEYWRFVKRSSTAVWILMLIMLLLGFVATLQTLTQDSSHDFNQINVYWLLLILLGLNGISVLFWLGFNTRASLSRSETPSQSPIMAAFRWMLAQFSRRAELGLHFATWSEMNLLGRVGQWFTGTVLHAAWASYLAGGLLALMLVLSAKQYDFVWGSTILPEQVFINSTHRLGALPKLLGFSVPSVEQIVASKKDAVGGAADHPSLSPAVLRSTWANFLLGCILVYGILVRILLWVLCTLYLLFSRRKFAPDWENPYFFQLRTRLLPEHSSLGVVDADQHSEQLQSPLASSSLRNQSVVTDPEHSFQFEGQTILDQALLPQRAVVADYEWGGAEPPPLVLEQIELFGTVDEPAAQQGVLELLSRTDLPLILLVPMERVVDRGAARLLRKLSVATQLHLVVVRRYQQSSDAARWAAWKMVAERISLEHERVYMYSLVESG